MVEIARLGSGKKTQTFVTVFDLNYIKWLIVKSFSVDVIFFRHLFKPLVKRGYSKMFASVAVFALSAFFHEVSLIPHLIKCIHGFINLISFIF